MQLDRGKVKRALESTETMAAVLYTILVNQYGEDWLEWDPVTIYLELREDFGAEPSSETMDRLSALLIALTTGEFFARFEAFAAVIHAFCEGAPSFSMFDPVEPEEIGWTVIELSLIRDLLPFGYSVREYIKTALHADGYSPAEPPPVLGHVLEVKDPSSNIIKELAGDVSEERGIQYASFDNYIDDQMRDLAYQFHELGMSDELTRLLAEKDLEDEFIE